jgi:hypothetical protein
MQVSFVSSLNDMARPSKKKEKSIHLCSVMHFLLLKWVNLSVLAPYLSDLSKNYIVTDKKMMYYSILIT